MTFSLVKRKAAAAQDSQTRDINPTFRKYMYCYLTLARRHPRHE
jgi:hypothetical protein